MTNNRTASRYDRTANQRMHVGRRATIGLVALLGSSTAPSLAGADPHHPVTVEDQLASCANELNSTGLPVDVVVPSAGSSSTWVPSFHDPNQSECWNYGWAEYDAPAQVFEVRPRFGGPNITSTEWDCNHSVVSYGIYGQTSDGTWVYLRGGFMYGKLVDGSCGYSVDNPPSQASWARDAWSQWGGGRFRIATYSWSHDDPGFGHHHDLCADPTQCVWSTSLNITVVP